MRMRSATGGNQLEMQCITESSSSALQWWHVQSHVSQQQISAEYGGCVVSLVAGITFTEKKVECRDDRYDSGHPRSTVRHWFVYGTSLIAKDWSIKAKVIQLYTKSNEAYAVEVRRCLRGLAYLRDIGKALTGSVLPGSCWQQFEIERSEGDLLNIRAGCIAKVGTSTSLP